MKLIIDTDPGIDDAMAIGYAVADDRIDLVALTTVFGNVHTPQATRNALRLCDWLRVDIPVAQGAMAPRALPGFPPSHTVHGAEGFGDLPAANPSRPKIDEPAAEFLVRMAHEHAGELVLCPIGPLTNVAAAIDLDADFTKRLKACVIMGGSLREGGNITDYAEANIYHDPHAADVVFSAGGNIVMVGLDVTHRTLATRGDFQALAQASPKFGGRLNDMAQFYIDFYETVGKFDGCSLHDPAAVIACIDPDLFGFEPHMMRVTCDGDRSGETFASLDSIPPIQVCTKLDADALKQQFFKTLATLP
ncbi:MAG: nucleoside hydrolase [Pseudomonadota bacterium]